MNQDQIVVTEGQDLTLSLTLEDDGGKAMNLTGYSAESQWRSDFEADSPLVLALTVTLPNPSNGEIILSATAAELNDLVEIQGPSRYQTRAGWLDAFITSPSGKRDLIYRAAVIYEHTITRSA